MSSLINQWNSTMKEKNEPNFLTLQIREKRTVQNKSYYPKP